MIDNEMEVQAAFKTTTNNLLSAHPDQWTGEESEQLVLAMIGAMKDNVDNPVKLTEEEKEVITLMTRPSQEVLIRVFQTMLAKRGISLGLISGDRISRAANTPAFKTELKNSGKIKNVRASKLSNLLD